MFEEEFLEVEVCSGLLAILPRKLVANMARAAEVEVDVRKAAPEFQPGLSNFRVFKQLGLLFLEFLECHLVLRDEIGIVLKEFLGLRLEGFPRRVCGNGI